MSEKMLVFHSIRILIILVFLLIMFFDSEQVLAGNCNNRPYPTPIGYKCEDVVRLDCHGNNYADFRSSYDESWVILGTPDWAEKSNHGDSSGPNIQTFVANTRIESYEAWAKYKNELAKLKAEATGYNPDTNQNQTYKYINEQEKLFDQNYKNIFSINTNVTTIYAYVTCQDECEASTPLGCLDWDGGAMVGDLIIHKVYIGTPKSAKDTFDQVKQTALSMMKQNGSNTGPRANDNTSNQFYFVCHRMDWNQNMIYCDRQIRNLNLPSHLNIQNKINQAGQVCRSFGWDWALVDQTGSNGVEEVARRMCSY